jgi:hypothetical protein
VIGLVIKTFAPLILTVGAKLIAGSVVLPICILTTILPGSKTTDGWVVAEGPI